MGQLAQCHGTRDNLHKVAVHMTTCTWSLTAVHVVCDIIGGVGRA